MTESMKFSKFLASICILLSIFIFISIIVIGYFHPDPRNLVFCKVLVYIVLVEVVVAIYISIDLIDVIDGAVVVTDERTIELIDQYRSEQYDK